MRVRALLGQLEFERSGSVDVELRLAVFDVLASGQVCAVLTSVPLATAAGCAVGAAARVVSSGARAVGLTSLVHLGMRLPHTTPMN